VCFGAMNKVLVDALDPRVSENVLRRRGFAGSFFRRSTLMERGGYRVWVNKRP